MHHSLSVLQKLLMIDDAEDLDLVLLMYLLEYNSNCSDTTVSLWIYLKDEATSFNNITTDDVSKFQV